MVSGKRKGRIWVRDKGEGSRVRRKGKVRELSYLNLPEHGKKTTILPLKGDTSCT